MSDELLIARGEGAARPTTDRPEVGKRLFDLLVGSVLVVLFSPLLLVITLAVAATSPGPILFRQERMGRGRRPFRMLKFRTMEDGSDDAIHRAFVAEMFRRERNGRRGDGLQKLRDDPRVTAVGRVLRRLSLDELPQLFNVVAGQMSIVGPRPVLEWEVGLYRPEHLRRFEVKPGITGLWQVSGRSNLTMSEALDLDLEYVATRSPWLDLRILLRTLPVVVTGRGAS